MNLSKNDLEKVVLSLVPNQTTDFIGLSCNEIAELVNRPARHITQVLRNLTSKKLIQRSKEKPGLDKMQYFYYKAESNQTQFNNPIEGKTCNQCQRFSGLHKCILLELILENFPWVLNNELKGRALAVDLGKVKACSYFKERVNGHIKSKTMNAFLKKCQNIDTYLFRCPVERCGKIVDEFSNPYLKMNIGSNTFYCPHCGSPINFAYSLALDRYQVQYYDSGFDTLQYDYQTITGCKLPGRYEEIRPFGISITKEGSFYLDLQNEIIYLGSKMTPERYILSKDTAYFSLT